MNIILKISIFFLLLLPCEEKKLENIIITGSSTDFRWISYSFYNGKSGFETIKHQYSKDYPEKLILEIPNTVNRYGSIQTDKGIYKVFITSGDSLSIQINSNDYPKLIFSGKNAPHYNFQSYLNSKDSIHYSYTDDLLDFALKCHDKHNLRLNILSHYTKNNNVSNEFSDLMKNEFFYDYFIDLVSPISQGKLNIKKIPQKYFKNIDDSWFNNLSLLYSRKGTMALTDYIRIKNNGFDACREFSNKLLLDEIKFIKKQFKDKNLQDASLLYIINSYSNNSSPEAIPTLVSTFEALQPNLKSQLNKDFSQNLSKRLLLLNTLLPENILSLKLINLNNQEKSIGDLLNSNYNKKVIVDLWASWCFPCIEDLENSIDFRAEVSNTNTIEWIYLSIDKNTQKWKSKVDEKKELGISTNQYKFLNTKDMEIFYDYFFINETGIPRYLVFDSKNRLILPNAPRPSDSIYFKKIINEIK